MNSSFTRRQLIVGGMGLAGAGLLAACSSTGGGAATRAPVSAAPTPSLGKPSVEATLRVGVDQVDLGGVTASTWLYDGVLPGKELRAKSGDVLAIRDIDGDFDAIETLYGVGYRYNEA